MSGINCWEKYLKKADSINYIDTDGLLTIYPDPGDLIDLYNQLKIYINDFNRSCAPMLDESRRRAVLSELMFAQLLIAGALYKSGVDNDITRLYSKYFDILFDFESFKILDNLKARDIVEMMERRRGGVYDVLRVYIRKQYYIFDEKWAPKLGILAIAFNNRYKERRDKIREALTLYVNRNPLSAIMWEFEEAAKTILESLQVRESIESELKKISDGLAAIENLIINGEYDKASELAREAIRQLREKADELTRKYYELKAEKAELSGSPEARALVQSEASQLERLLHNIEEVLEKYKLALEKLKAEKLEAEEVIEDFKKAREGLTEGHLVTVDEARALEVNFIQRLRSKLEDGAVIYDPLKNETKRIKWDKIIEYELNPGGKPSGKGIRFIHYRGLIWKTPDVTLDALVYTHTPNYAKKGYDNNPVTLKELLDLIEDKLVDAWSSKYYLVQIIASPTGFTNNAIKYFRSGELSIDLLSKRATVYLIDLVSGEIYYNDKSSAAVANAKIVEPWLEEEKIKIALNYLESEEAFRDAVMTGHTLPYLTARQVSEKLGIDLAAVKRAMFLAERKGIGEIRIVDGITAFVYKK